MYLYECVCVCKTSHLVSVEYGTGEPQEGSLPTLAPLRTHWFSPAGFCPLRLILNTQSIAESIQFKVLDYIDPPPSVFSASLCPYEAHLPTVFILLNGNSND